MNTQELRDQIIGAMISAEMDYQDWTRSARWSDIPEYVTAVAIAGDIATIDRIGITLEHRVDEVLLAAGAALIGRPKKGFTTRWSV